MDKIGGVLEVDLIHAVSPKLGYDSPVSLREALIFTELAYFPQNPAASSSAGTLRWLKVFHLPSFSFIVL